MAQRTDYKTLQRLSAGESENNRAARVDRLAEALAATRALPAGLTCGRVDLGRAADELRDQLTAGNPFLASPADAHIARGELEQLRPGCAYDPDADRSIGALIASTDALEDRLLSNR